MRRYRPLREGWTVRSVGASGVVGGAVPARVPGVVHTDLLAAGPIRDLTLQTDRRDPDAVVDDQLVTLLPGERVTFAVASIAELDEADLLTHPVLRTANELLTGGPPECSEKQLSSPD